VLRLVHLAANLSLTLLLQASCETLIVGETKKYVEQACAIWTDKLQYKNLKIVNLDEMDPASQPPTLMTWRPTIVTGFSRNHLRVGLLLLRSVGRAAANPIVSKHYNVSLVVWVMEEFTSSETEHLNCTIKELKDVYHINVELRKADFAKYPTWMRINPSLFNIQEGGRGEDFFLHLHVFFHNFSRSINQSLQQFCCYPSYWVVNHICLIFQLLEMQGSMHGRLYSYIPF